MYKIVFDSDALIKLIKAKLPKEVFESFEAVISDEVYEECVIEGKKALFEDAFVIEMLLKEGLIKKLKARKNTDIEKILKEEDFGKGEASSLHLYKGIKAGAICSDDEKFLNFLDKNGISFVLPADFVIRLKEVNLFSKEDAINVLNGLKPFIKEQVYLKFKKQIGD